MFVTTLILKLVAKWVVWDCPWAGGGDANLLNVVFLLYSISTLSIREKMAC
jgi:hypothetical protein